MSDSLLVGFCHGDDFCQLFLPRWQQQLVTPGVLQRNRPRPPCLSAIMTIVSAFHTSHYRDLTAFSLFEVQGYWRTEFPGVHDGQHNGRNNGHKETDQNRHG